MILMTYLVGVRNPSDWEASPLDVADLRAPMTDEFGVVNKSSGQAGDVVQAGNIHGDVIFNKNDREGLTVPRQLPPSILNFIGRKDDLAELDAALNNTEQKIPGAVVITAIAGMAGIGKTALAVQWAHLNRQNFPDGDLYVNMRGFDSNKPIGANDALEGFLLALGVLPRRIPVDVASRSSLFRSLLSERRMLVLLDNAVSAEQVRPLIPSAQECLVLVTSRNRLSGLVARDGARRVSLGLLSADDAITLLSRVVGEGRVEQELTAAREIAQLCAYLPLALRIAAVRVASSPDASLKELIRELQSERGRLDFLEADGDEGTAVRAVFSWSYHALGIETARMFRLLGLLTGTEIVVDEAAIVSNTPKASAKNILERLASVHLLERGLRGIYRFHDLLRVYAFERVEADETADSLDEVRRRLKSWDAFTEVRKTANSYRRMNEEWARAVTLRSAGDIAAENGWTDEAMACFKDSISIFTQIEDSRHLGFVHYSIGRLYQNNNLTDRAMLEYQKAIASFELIGDEVDKLLVVRAAESLPRDD